MLARLDQVAGVERAEVDRAGDLLRLTLHPDALGRALSALHDLGYEADIDTSAVATTAWYDRSSVGDLSFIEAGAIAARVVPAFARARTLSAEDTAALHDTVVAALHRCFTQRAVGDDATTGAFRHECVRQVTEAASASIGADAASLLGALLDADLTQDHRDR